MGSLCLNVTVRQSISECRPVCVCSSPCDLKFGINLCDQRKESDCPVITQVIKLGHYLYLCPRPSAVLGLSRQLR